MHTSVGSVHQIFDSGAVAARQGGECRGAHANRLQVSIHSLTPFRGERNGERILRTAPVFYRVSSLICGIRTACQRLTASADTPERRFDGTRFATAPPSPSACKLLT